MYCPNCGTKIDGGKFCPKCGTPTGEFSGQSTIRSTTADTQKAKPQNQRNRNKKKPWLIPVGFVAAVCLLLIGVCIVKFIYGKIEESKRASLFDFPNTEESVDVTKAIQGVWAYGTKADGCILTFEGANEFELIRYLDTDGLSSDTKYTISGRYAIDSENDIIYLISNEEEPEELEDADDVIYDYTSNGGISLYYDGHLLEYVQ